MRSASGPVIGHLVDPTAVAGTDPYPEVRRAAVGRRGKVRWLLDWHDVTSFEHGGIELSSAVADTPSNPATELDLRELLLARDVLDTQIVDVAGKRWREPQSCSAGMMTRFG